MEPNEWIEIFDYAVWGNAAEWVAAVGTVGTLAVAVGLIFRDRRAAEKLQANQILVYRRFHEDEEIIEVDNASDRPIYSVEIYSRPDRSGVIIDTRYPVALQEVQDGIEPAAHFFDQQLLDDGRPITINPGQGHSFHMPYYPHQYRQVTTVAFVDAHGRQWAKHSEEKSDGKRGFEIVRTRKLEEERSKFGVELEKSRAKNDALRAAGDVYEDDPHGGGHQASR